MGWVAATSGRFPPALGWILVVGGVAYVASAFVEYAIEDAPAWLVDLLAAPATIGELWMIGYLLLVGIRRGEEGGLRPDSAVSARGAT